jgi:hypothetical protein
MGCLEYVVKGMRRLTAGGPQRTRLPITPDILLKVKIAWEAGTRLMGYLHVATMCFCFLRAGGGGI